MSTLRVAPTRGRVVYDLLEKGPGGNARCRYCRRECPARQMTFCSPTCVHEHRVRTDPAYAREAVLLRDKGVCAVCRVDTLAVAADLRKRRPKERKALAARLGWPLARLKTGPWEADHIVPVAEGGGECGLEGYQTLCLGCHRAKSAAQAVRRARAAKATTGAGSEP